MHVKTQQGATWKVTKDRASLLAFHERATRLGAVNGVAFGTAPAELQAYLADVVQHASSSGAKAMIDVFLDAEGEELGPEEAFVDQIVKLVKETDAGEQLAERFAQYVSTRDASTNADVVLQDARDQAGIEAKEALSRKTASILKAVRHTCDEHRRDRDRILAESAANLACESEKFDALQKLSIGAIQSADRKANEQCVRLTKENEALREELNAVVRRGVSDLSNSSTKNNPFPYEQQVVTSSSGSGSGSYGSSGGESSGGNESWSKDGSTRNNSVSSAPHPGAPRDLDGAGRYAASAATDAAGPLAARDAARGRRRRRGRQGRPLVVINRCSPSSPPLIIWYFQFRISRAYASLAPLTPPLVFCRMSSCQDGPGSVWWRSCTRSTGFSRSRKLARRTAASIDSAAGVSLRGHNQYCTL